MSMLWGGQLDSKLSNATSLVAKLNYANTYGRLHYSVKAYPSPALNNDEWETIFKIVELKLNGIDSIPQDYDGTSWILDNNYASNLDDSIKSRLRKRYAMRPNHFNLNEDNWDDITDFTVRYDERVFGVDFGTNYLKISQMNLDGLENISQHYIDNIIKDGHEQYYEAKAMPEYIIYRLRQELSELNHIGTIKTDIGEMEVIDRMEKCLVTKKGGLEIDAKKQLDNLFRYYADDRSESYTIYYDAKTMLPLMPIKEDIILKEEINGEFKEKTFRIKVGTTYYKWTRTVKHKEYEDDSILAHSFVIDADTFPADYRIVGETCIRNQKTGKDERFQIIIFKANISSNTSITLQSDGDPTTFTMDIDVLVPENDVMMELRQINVEEDRFEGGTRIVPQSGKYTYTPSMEDSGEITIPIDNNEIY